MLDRSILLAGRLSWPAAFQVVSPTQLRVTIPPGAQSGFIILKQGTQVITQTVTQFVVPPTPATLSIVNNSQYPIFSLTVGTNVLASFHNLLHPGQTRSIQLNPGTYPIRADAGYFVGQTVYWSVWHTDSRTLSSGGSVTFSVPATTVQQVLSYFGASRDWSGTYWDSNVAPHTATFRFFSTGAFQFFDDGRLIDSGYVSPGPWPVEADQIRFSVGQYQADLFALDGFDQFVLSNGPPSWRNIQYFRQ